MESQDTIDWLLSSKVVARQLNPKLKRMYKKIDEISLNVLDVGCGTSELPLYLLRDSEVPVKLFCVDYAEGSLKWQKGLISKLNQNHGNILSNYYLVMADICQLPFKENYFHAIIDKGTTDSILKSLDGTKLAENMMSELVRTLHPSGYLWQITDEDLDVRLTFLQQIKAGASKSLSSSFEILSHGNVCDYFLYTVKKGVF